MKARIRQQLSAARRALDYAQRHPIDDNGFRVALQRLEAAVTLVTNLGLQESAGRSGRRAGVLQRRAARRKIRDELLIRVVSVAAQAIDDDPTILGVFSMPRSGPNKRFLLEARSLLAATAARVDTLIPLGLGDHFVDDLGTALDQFEATGTTIDTGRGLHVGAVRTYGKAIDNCRRAINVIETYYRAAAIPDESTLAGWINARTVEGPFTRHKGADDISAPSGDDPSGPHSH
ncbi:MAG TPA: hypothetical protein VGM20_07380 [Gemmatimonadales bacterium]|jgi:hypothetical protein